jgi:hypothetical protein
MLSGAHLHLLVNHIPLFAAICALALLAASFLWAPDVLRRAAFVALMVAALGAMAADLSGDPAEDAIRGFPGVKREVIHTHEEMADKSYFVAGAVGILALVALVKWRRVPVPRAPSIAALVCAAVVSGMMAYTALLGGRVRHTEVRPGAIPTDATIIEPRPTRPPPQQ